MITGAAGMLGQAVVERFASCHDVVPHRRSDCDLADLHATVRWFREARPDHVVHCAAWTDVDGCEGDPVRARRDNAWATRHVALACQLAGAALCHVSTDYVFDGRKDGPYDEEDATAPLSVYGWSKLEAEAHVVRHAPRWAIVRTSWLYGPGGRNFLRTMAHLVRSRDAVRVVDDQRGAPTATRDLAAALLAVVDRGLEGVLHWTNAGACTWYELARVIGARFSPACRIEPCTSAEYPRPAARPPNSQLAAAGALRLGLPPARPWRAAVDEYLEILAPEVGA